MFRTIATLAAAGLMSLGAACGQPDDGDRYAMWIHDNDKTGETYVLFKSADGERMTAAHKADGRADFEAYDARRALDHFEDVRKKGAGATVNIRAEGEVDEEFGEEMEKTFKEGGFTMRINDDEVVIRMGDAFIIEAKDDDAFIKIGDEDGGIMIDAKGEREDEDALVVIGGMDADDTEDAIDDLDDAPRDLRRQMKKDLGL